MRREDGSQHCVIAYGPGVDEVQALQNALDGARILLAKSGDRIEYEGRPGSGIRMAVTGFTAKLQQHLEQLVENECDSVGRQLEDPATRQEMLRRFKDDDR